jgi:heptosyltransferase-2
MNIKKLLTKAVLKLGNFWFRFEVAKETFPEKIIVFTCPGIGDSVMLTASVAQLRKKYPNKQIDVQVFPQTVDIWKNNPDIDNYFVGDKDLKTLWKIRRTNYDLAICYRFFTTPLFAYICGIPMRRGPYESEEGFALTQKVKNPRAEYVIDHHANIAGVEPNHKMKLFLDKEDCEVEINGITVAPDAGTTETARKKMWPAEHYGELCNMIGKPVTILGMNRQHTNKMIKVLDVPYLDYTGKLSVGKFAGAIKNSKLVICNDSAAMHIASCFNVPCCTIFGPTSKTFLAHKNVIAVNYPVECQPCFGEERFYKCKGRECLKKLRPEQVYRKIKKKGLV